MDLGQHDADVLRLVGHAGMPYGEVADGETALPQRRLAGRAGQGDLRVQMVLRDVARGPLPLLPALLGYRPVVRAQPALRRPVLRVHPDQRHVGHEREALGRVRELDVIVYWLTLVLEVAYGRHGGIARGERPLGTGSEDFISDLSRNRVWTEGQSVSCGRRPRGEMGETQLQKIEGWKYSAHGGASC